MRYISSYQFTYLQVLSKQFLVYLYVKIIISKHTNFD